jgi:hypothetical protein
METASISDKNVATPMLRGLWEKWKRTARKIADFQARLLLTFFYFIFFCPFALLVKWFSDPLALKGGKIPQWGSSTWHSETHLERAKRQF